MFEKFAAVRHANKEERAYSEALSPPLGTERSTFGPDPIYTELCQMSMAAIRVLSKDELVELTGAVFFGRDSAVKLDDAFGELSRCTRDLAYLANQSGHISYLSENRLINTYRLRSRNLPND